MHSRTARWLVPAASVLALVGAALIATGIAQAAGAPKLVVSRVSEPSPLGQVRGHAMTLKAMVANRGGASAGSSVVRFLLSLDRRRSRDDIRAGSSRVGGLRAGASVNDSETWRVRANAEPGLYYVLACEGNNCRSSAQTIPVMAQPVTTAARAGGRAPGATADPKPPKTEHFPEIDDGYFGMAVGAPEDCPASAHGQGGGKCVWVKTNRYESEHGNDPGTNTPRVRTDFWYCPSGYPYPFEVAIGFDPLWEDIGFHTDTFAESVARQRYTLYRSILGRDYYPSFGAPNGFERGYVTIDFNGGIRGYWKQRAQFLCSNKRANSMLP